MSAANNSVISRQILQDVTKENIQLRKDLAEAYRTLVSMNEDNYGSVAYRIVYKAHIFLGRIGHG
jgi:hypothetical protein